MRFDLTVNEFTRDLWADRELEVFGEQFWRPYVHVRDAGARRGPGARGSDLDKVAGARVQRGPLGRELPQARPGRDHHRPAGPRQRLVRDKNEDPRDYKVGFERIKDELGFEPAQRVPEGIAELIDALGDDAFPDPWGPQYRNT